jgi:hypothetical protein
MEIPQNVPPVVGDVASFMEEKKQLLLGIGLCITEWSMVDFQLLRLTCDALGTGSRRSAIVYLSTGMLSKRIELVSELVECVLLTPIADSTNKKNRPVVLKEWDSIVKEIREIVPFRNHLAHWQLGASIKKRGTKQFKPALRVGLPEIFREKPKDLASESIFYEDIVKHHERLLALIAAISAFGPRFAKEAKDLPQPSRKLSWLWKPTRPVPGVKRDPDP